MKVLILGGTGFIGSAFSNFLAEKGDDVTLLCRNKSISTLYKTILAPEFNLNILTLLLQNTNYDYVFNFAAYGVSPEARDFQIMQDINVDLPCLLIQILKGRISTFVQIGSSAEYEVEKASPLKESDRLETSQLYGVSKAQGMLKSFEIAKELGVNFCGVRLFQVYGKGEKPYRLLPWLYQKLKAGEEVPLSPGDQIRDFMLIDDVCEGLLELAKAVHKNGGQEIFNLSSGVGVSVKDFATELAKIANFPAKLLEFGALDYRKDDKMFVVGNPTLMYNYISWRPQFNLASGLAFVLKGFSRD
jgi:nucleoside-diphosphate-sugar epimerase